MPDGPITLADKADNKTPDRGGKLQLGVVAGAHGVRGLVRVKSFTADPSDLTAYGPLQDGAGRTVRLELAGESKGQLLARIEGVADRTEAERWRGEPLFIARAQLPAPEADDDFYHADLLGLTVEALSGEALGTVTAIHDFGAGDVLELATPEGATRYLPFTRDAVPTVDLAAGRLIADPPVEVGDPESVEAGNGEEGTS